MRHTFKVVLAGAVLILALLLALRFGRTPGGFELRKGDRVVFLGDTFVEQEQHHGWIELMLTARFPNRNVTFRNLGWSADTPEGESRLGLSLLQAGHEPDGEGWKQLVKQIEEAKPSVVFLGYGMADSFRGEAGLARFKDSYLRLLDVIRRVSPHVRLVLLGPIPHERLGPPWPDPAPHNSQLALYDRTVGEIAASRHAAFISLFDLLQAAGASTARLTDNGIHLNYHGYRVVAEVMEEHLFKQPGAWRTSPQTEALRQAILRKNEWFFYRSRPGNMAYIFGFRRHEQGVNAAEVPKFDEFVLAEEKRIAKLSSLQPVDVPELPRRIGNLVTRPTEQAHPEFEVANGFEVTLWAENPLLEKPVQMNFDARGRLWVACIPDYPQIEPGQAPTDKIIVLEDVAGHGRADRATVFADNLLLPMGLEPGDGGVYVALGTELLFLKDTKGDGKADIRRVVLSGFGTEDSHHQLHTLRWGPDGRLYMNQSVYTRSNIETPEGVVRLRAGGIFRFDPRDQRLEVAYRGWINAWGHQFDAFGQSFITDGAGSLGINWGVTGATYATLAPARRTLQSISPGSYPKFCGLEIVRSEQFPADWQGDFITCDFRANRVVRFKIADQGAGYVTRQMPDLLDTAADTFRPVDVKLGPDGALYIADWSNPIIQHGEVDFRDPRRDKIHGRIWRVAAKGRALLPTVDFTQSTTVALLDQLTSPNGYNQAQARRALVERGAESVLPDLAAWTRAHPDERSLLQALWMNEAFNQPLAEILNPLLSARDAGVRAAAVRALSPGTPDAVARLARLVTDENPRVRLEAVRGLGKIPSLEAADLALTVLDRPMDPFLDYALWLTVNELADPWLAAVKSGTWKFTGRDRQIEFSLNALEPARTGEVLGRLLSLQPIPRNGSGPWIELIGTAGGPAELRLLFAQMTAGGLDEPATVQALAALDQAARLRQAVPEGDLTGLDVLLRAADEPIRTGSLRLIGAWKLAALIPRLVQKAGDPATPAAECSAAFSALREIGGAVAIDSLRKIMADPSSPQIRREAVLALARLDLRAALPDIISALKATTDPGEGPLLWRGLLGVAGARSLLASELPKAKLPPEVALAGLRPAREGGQYQPLVQALMRIAGLTLSNVQLSSAEMQAIAQEAIAKGNAARGERLFRRPELACISCHSIGGVGGKVGPDLTSIGASAQGDYLVESVLYPNAKIKEGYHAVLLTTKAQQVISGIITRENDREVVLRDAAGQEVSVPIRDISARSELGSLMPAGLIDPLLPEERLDLFKFLSVLGKPGDFDAAKRDVARLWRIYQVVSKNTHLGTERVKQGDFTLADWVPAYSLVNGTLPAAAIVATFSERDQSRGLFAATTFQSTKGGLATFDLAGEVSDVWINGRPAKPGERFTAETKPGTNVLVARFAGSPVNRPLKLTSVDVSFLTE